jgi:hypothetical protein
LIRGIKPDPLPALEPYQPSNLKPPAAAKALLAQAPMAGYSKIDADELFPSNDSMAIVVA